MRNWLLGFAALLFFLPVALSVISRLTTPDTGLVHGRLRECPGSANCVSSEDIPGPFSTEPVIITVVPAERAWEKAKQAIQGMGGTIVKQNNTYLHATFTTPVFRFVDDMELRLDAEKKAIQIRSASRIGYSDMGANRKRVTEFRQKIGPL